MTKHFLGIIYIDPPKFIVSVSLLCLCAHACKNLESEKGVGSPGTRIRSSCEVSELGTRIQTSVLWKSSKCF